jgi:hypothetical protein
MTLSLASFLSHYVQVSCGATTYWRLERRRRFIIPAIKNAWSFVFAVSIPFHGLVIDVGYLCLT